jgi:hypothetical protein
MLTYFSLVVVVFFCVVGVPGIRYEINGESDVSSSALFPQFCVALPLSSGDLLRAAADNFRRGRETDF